MEKKCPLGNKPSLKKRRRRKMAFVMGEMAEGKLHSGSKKGPIVKNPKQGIAIAISEAKKIGKKKKKK